MFICLDEALIPSNYLFAAGAIDASSVLEQLEVQISSAKEEAFSRKDVLERVEKWLAACEEENWLEGYNRVSNSCKLQKQNLVDLCSQMFKNIVYICRTETVMVQEKALT